jgi:hypothetical protein
MTSKGPSPVDPQPAETSVSRRSLLTTLGVAGVASAAAVAIATPASASPPYPTTEADRDLLSRTLRVELAAKRLYDDAVASGIGEEAAAVAEVFGGNHEAYADQMAAITGISADTFDESFYEQRAAAFASGDVVEFATAAWELENSMAATYIDLFNDFESIDAHTVVSSIVVVNGRMATVLADLAGVTAFGEVLRPEAEIITLSEGENA